MSAVIRPAGAADISAMAAIEAASPHAAQWGERGLADELAIPGGIMLVAEDGGAAGFVAGRTIAGIAALYNIAVDPPRLRRGTGRALVEAFCSAALSAGCSKVELEVNAVNAPAIKLYASCGFRVVGRRPKFYNLTDDAILLDRELL